MVLWKKGPMKFSAFVLNTNFTEIIFLFSPRVAQAYLNQKKLDAEAKQLHTNAITFSKQTQQWLSLVDNFNSALKEIGDVENWAKVIEEDMRLISAALETAYEGSINENTSAAAAKEDN